MKSEPSTFGIDDLRMLGQQTEPWDGVRNYQARNMIRDDMQVGDRAFFYHSNCPSPGIVGEMKIVRSAYPDATALDPDSKYYCPLSSRGQNRWFVVDVQFVRQYPGTVTLDALKKHPGLVDLPVVRKGNRLSVIPVTPTHWRLIQTMVDDL